MYITATYIFVPTDPKRTAEKDFGSDPDNFIAEEVVSLVKNLRNKDLRRCNVILDVDNESVIKCRSFIIDGKEADSTYATLLEHFKEMYPREIEELLKITKEKKEIKSATHNI